MRQLGILVGFGVVCSAAWAQSEPSLSTMAPVLGDIGLTMLAVGLGLGGAWGVSKFRRK